MNHHFADRLQTLSKEMREDEVRAHPEIAEYPQRSSLFAGWLQAIDGRVDQ
jgi:hypothetical protein